MNIPYKKLWMLFVFGILFFFIMQINQAKASLTTIEQHIVSNDTGGSWTFHTVATAPIGAHSIDVGSNGIPQISFYDHATLALNYATFVNGIFDLTIIASPAGDPGVESSNNIDVDGNNLPHVSHNNVINGTNHVWFDGVQWQSESVSLTENRSAGISVNPSAPYTSSIAYIQHRPRREVWFAYWDGIYWLQEPIAQTNNMGEFINIEVDPVDPTIRHVVYYENTTFNLKYAIRENGLWTVETIDFIGAEPCCSAPSLAVDSNGSPYVCYDNNITHDVRIAQRISGTWQIDNVASGMGCSLDFDTHGNLHILYFDLSTSEMVYAHNENGNFESEVVTGAVAPGKLVIDDSNTAHVLYYSNGTFQYATKPVVNQPPINVIDVSPINAAFNVEQSEIVSALFDLDVNAGTISNQTFTVRGEQTGVYTGAYTINGNMVEFDNHVDFKPGEEIAVTLSQDIQSTGGANLLPYAWQFRAAVDGGSGVFVDSGQSLENLYSVNIALGDLDSDGDLDAFVANQPTTANKIWLNDGDGIFNDSGQNLGNSDSYGVSLGDLDNDGDLDAFIGNYNNQPNKIWLNDGNGIFNDSGQNLGNSRSYIGSLGDLDGDGDLDAFVANWGQPNKIWLNDGNGTFIDSGQSLGNYNSYVGELGDLDGDGDLDAIVANSIDQANKVWLNDGTGTLSEAQSLGGADSISLAIGDIDGDGDLDVFVSNQAGQAGKVWLNNGNGTFIDSNQNLGNSKGSGVDLGDLDDDGDLDAFEINWNQPNTIWLNDGLGNFIDNGQMQGNSNDRTIALGDVDGDGDLDAFIGHRTPGGANKVWFNEPASIQVTQTIPLNASHNVPKDAIIDATFDQNVDFNTINSSTFTVRGDQSGNYQGVYNDGETSVQFDPNQDFWPGEEVTINLSHYIQSVGGASLEQPYAWQFRAAVGGGFGTFVDNDQEMGNLQSHGIALGDMDGDGDLDAFVGNIGSASGGQPNKVWLNDGNGNFTDSGQLLGNRNSYRVDLGDLDGDGDLDAFVGNAVQQPNKVWLNDGTGMFTDSGQNLGNSHTLGVKLGDLDGDGDLDAFESGHFGDPNKVWWNDGTGTFTDSGQNLGNSRSGDVALGDLDGDGDLDAFIGNTNFQPNRVWFNDGSGIFTDSGQQLGNSQSHGRTVLGDLDGDGDLDAFVGNILFHSSKVWMNNGTGIFTLREQDLGITHSYGIALGDLDNDGDLDAFVGNGGESNKVWLNDGAGNFITGIQIQGLGNSNTEGVALGDLDGDGDLDAFAVNNGQANKVWFNQPLNQPPEVTAGGPYDVAEGGSIVVESIGNDPDGDTLTYIWDLDNDGVFETPGQNVVFSAENLTGPATQTIAVQVTDPAGLLATAQTTINILQGVCPSQVILYDDFYNDALDSVTWRTDTNSSGSGYDIQDGVLTLNSGTTFGGGFAVYSNQEFIPGDYKTFTLEMNTSWDIIPEAGTGFGFRRISSGFAIAGTDRLTGNFIIFTLEDEPGEPDKYVIDDVDPAQEHTYRLEFSDNSLFFYVDNILEETITQNIPTNIQMPVFFSPGTPPSGENNFMEIDSVKVTTTLNCAPEADEDGYSTNEDVALNVPAPAVLSNDTDLNSDPLTAVLDTTTNNGTLTLNGDGSFDYTPNADYCGLDSFTYHANDGTADSNIATVTIDVVCVDDAPVAVDDEVTTDEDTVLNGDVFADNGSGVDSDVDGDTLTVTSNTNPSNGYVTVNPVGTFTYTPNLNFNGTDSFTYTISDGNGGSDTATVTITVNAVNDAPVADGDSYSTYEDTPLSTVVPGVLDGDTDVEGDVLTAVLDTTTSNGSLTLNSDGSFNYTPNADYCGLDNFTYHANDGTADSNIATVTIDVICINDAPVADDDNYNTNEDTAFNEAAPGVLDGDTDVEGDVLTAVLDTTTSNGSLTLNSDGSFNYTPNADYCGPDSFTYHVNDGTADSNIATVTIDVICVNDPPEIVVNQTSVVVDEGITAVNDGTFSDIDSTSVTLSVSGGIVIDNGNGIWSWSFNTTDGPADSQTVTITVDDGQDTSEVYFTLTVNNVAPTPDAGADQIVFRNEVVTVSGSWTDPAGNADNPYTWSWDLNGDSLPDSGGTAAFGDTVEETTSFANEGFYTLTFTVKDKDGDTGSDNLVIEVRNRPPDCSNVIPSLDELWPPNHEFVAIDVLGVIDPEGDPIIITIDSIFQDEPVDSTGDGSFTPDGQGVGTTTAEVRAERDGGGNGRVYHIYFTADDGHGGTCSSEVLISIPKSKGKNGAAVDDGPVYDSTIP